MDSGHRAWPPGPPGSAQPKNQEQGQSQAPRPGASFGPGTTQHQPHQSPPSGPSGLAPPSGPPFPSFHQPSHGLASLANISQSSPRPPPPGTHRSDQPQGPGYSLPGLSQATGQLAGIERERERAREEIHIKEEEDRRHRELDRQRLEQAPPHHAHGGPPVHLHQPVAVGPRSVHGPNGLLSNPGLAGPQPQLPLGAPSGPSNVFAASQAPGSAPGPPPGQPMQPGLLMPFAQGQPPQAPAMNQGQPQGPGQQPILNDALSYLDQVKVQFSDHPDVYNRFLDIMKDFKSGAIDTPGVIGRVSTLFAGNPELIQGFNTFLPPGYRIECGSGGDPNAIRVTTPMGTTVQAMPRPASRTDGPGGDLARPSNGTFTPQPNASAQMMFSPSGRAIGPAIPGPQPGQHLSPQESVRQQEQQAMHQQEERGVNSLQSAVSAATAGGPMRPGASPRTTPLPTHEVGADAGGPVMEKRAPVEFNHAISYVNKIKNRFSAHPDIYKQFLEILQTYQRESKPIQDVYSQVTQLFKTAPDLLEDFKQFLPESAAQAKAAERARQAAEENIMTSNVRGESGGMYGSPVMSREPHVGTPGHVRNLPPVGNFAPTPVSKDNKRKRTDNRPGAGGAVVDGPIGLGKAPVNGQPGKRVKQTHPGIKDVVPLPPTSPSLVPALPAPLPPNTTTAATSEELAFFDKAKKVISNKNSMNEFLKLCNLFSQDLIDRSTLVHRAKAFIGGNADLMKWFVDFVGYEERDVIIENKARMPGGRVSLSNCRGLGPSYRLLPKRERQKPCSGRDELCNAVLNDEWASHPTWASEDSGFIAHRKNQNEEGLHRIEEERHDYDFNIETCSRTIQLLEPLAQQLRRMTIQEQESFQLPPGLGGQSQTIYKRVIMKLYGREKGQEVITQLERAPYQVIPVLLNRLKERLETWKMAQREWEKVWRDQTQKMFWKSLDHQHANATKADKRSVQTKTLQNEIQIKHEEMRRLEMSVPGTMKKPQMIFQIPDEDVLVDVAYLLYMHADFSLAQDHPDLPKFIKDFVPLFFGLDIPNFQLAFDSRMGEHFAEDVMDESGAEEYGSRTRKPNTKENLHRQAVDPGRNNKLGRKERESSIASGSRGSTPDVNSTAGVDGPADAGEGLEEKEEGGAQRWFDHPNDGNKLQQANVDPNEPQQRDTYRLWANTSIYCFIRTFVMLYERLCRLKNANDQANKIVQSAKKPKAASELGIMDKEPVDFFADTSDGANYYRQILGKFEEVLRGDLEMVDVEDCLRRYYLQIAYPLYNFDKMIQAMGRYATLILNGEGKDKSLEIWHIYRKDRVRDSTTMSQQTDYRKAVEKMIKDGDVYKIDYDQANKMISVYLTKKDDLTLLDDGISPMDQENRWRAYIASYQTVDDTEGVDHSAMNRPLLFRNMRAVGADPQSASYPPSPHPGAEGSDGDADGVGERLFHRFMVAKTEENLVLRIAVDNYKTHFQPQTQEGWSLPMVEREGGKEGVEEREVDRNHRDDTMRDFLMNHEGMKDLAQEEVEAKNQAFTRLTTGQAENDEDKMDVE